MLDAMSFDDFMNWRAFDLIEPFGDRRADYHAASICAAVFNSMLIRVGSRRRMSLQDFVLEFKDSPTEVQKDESAPPVAGWQQMKMIAKMRFAASRARTTTKQQQAKRRTQRPPRPQKQARRK